MRNSLKFALHVFIVCIATLIVLSFFQRHLIYFPTVFETYDHDVLARKNLMLVTGENNLQWLVSPYKGVDGKNAVVVLFHGNGGAAIDRFFKADLFNRHGYDVVLAEYPGYATNTHLKPTEANFYAAGREIIRKTKQDFPRHGLILYGESIGSGTAIEMAREFDVKALVIESGFTSMPDMAQLRYPILPVRYFVWDKFDNLSKIGEIDTRIIILHGVQDGVVPFAHGQALFSAAHNKQNITLIPLAEAGHNNIYDDLLFADFIKHLD